MFSTLRFAICICATLIVFSAVYVESAVPAAPQESDAVVVKMTAERKFMPEKITIRVEQTVNGSTTTKQTHTKLPPIQMLQLTRVMFLGRKGLSPSIHI
jgi:hypothetical protein